MLLRWLAGDHGRRRSHGLSWEEVRAMNEHATATVRHPHERELEPRMRAIVQTEYGSSDVLRVAEIDRPEIGDDEVLVRVHAAGLDRGTWHLMAGQAYLIRLMGYGLRAPKNRTDAPERHDLILDIGGNSRLSRLRRALTRRGTLVI